MFVDFLECLRPIQSMAVFLRAEVFGPAARSRADSHDVPCCSSSTAGVSNRAIDSFGWRRRCVSIGRASTGRTRKVLFSFVMVDFYGFHSVNT